MRGREVNQQTGRGPATPAGLLGRGKTRTTKEIASHTVAKRSWVEETTTVTP